MPCRSPYRPRSAGPLELVPVAALVAFPQPFEHTFASAGELGLFVFGQRVGADHRDAPPAVEDLLGGGEVVLGACPGGGLGELGLELRALGRGQPGERGPDRGAGAFDPGRRRGHRASITPGRAAEAVGAPTGGCGSVGCGQAADRGRRGLYYPGQCTESRVMSPDSVAAPVQTADIQSAQQRCSHLTSDGSSSTLMRRLMRAESGTAVVESTLLLSVGLSLLNSIPLFPFDGGRVTEAAIDAGLGGGAARWFRVGTGVVAVGLLLLYLIVADVWWLIT